MTTHRGRPSWTGEQQAELARMWGEGLPTAVIANHFGLSTVAIYRQTKRMKLPRRILPRSDGLPAWEEQDADLIEMVNTGLINAEIAERLGRSEASIQARKSVLRARGLLPRVAKSAPAIRSKPPVAAVRKRRKCLHCRETFRSQHATNWICASCAPIVNNMRGAIA